MNSTQNMAFIPARIDPIAVAIQARAARDQFVGTMLANGIRRGLAAVKHWFDHRRTLAALDQLDSRILADIGLDRAAFNAGIIRRVDDERSRIYTRGPSVHNTVDAAALSARTYAPDLAAAANDVRRAA